MQFGVMFVINELLTTVQGNMFITSFSLHWYIDMNLYTLVSRYNIFFEHWIASHETYNILNVLWERKLFSEVLQVSSEGRNCARPDSIWITQEFQLISQYTHFGHHFHNIKAGSLYVFAQTIKKLLMRI